ncbi:MAG: nucleotide exchange factor GrpE [Chthoniobacterales bacterium]
MQTLAAQAAPSLAVEQDDALLPSGISALISAVHSLGQRLESLEETVLRQIESIHFQKMEEEISAIRESERVNQKLFDSLHEELISYRDNFVRESLQKPFIRDLLVLFDDLSGIAAQFEGTGTGTVCQPDVAHTRDNLSNMLHFLLEILHRLEVNEIEPKEMEDRTLHRVIGVEPTECAEEDGRIVKRIKPGFTWHDRVLRPEEVVAKRFR